jgi:antitoxin PrlF
VVEPGVVRHVALGARRARVPLTGRLLIRISGRIKENDMARFTGSVTTTGRSEAIRLEKALFKAHPEFRQKAKVRADVIGYGTIIISVVDEDAAQGDEDDPIVEAFLSFLERDIEEHPERVGRLSETRIAEAVSLTENVAADDDEEIAGDVTL